MIEKRYALSGHHRTVLLGTAVAIPMMAFGQATPALAAPPPFVNVCTGLGVTLPILQPLAGSVVDPLIDALTNNINTNFQQTLSGRTIGIGVLDPATNTIVAVPANQCNISANSVAVDNANGVAIGGGQITGLGGTGNALPIAGDPSAIAIGNGATTAAVSTFDRTVISSDIGRLFQNSTLRSRRSSYSADRQ